MKSRLVALALAAVMTLGSCMSASAKDVFTKGMIGATVVKNGAYVENVDLIDVAIWEAANSDSLYQWIAANVVVDGDTTTTTKLALAAQSLGTTNATAKSGSETFTRALAQFSTEQQKVLLYMIQQYGQTLAKNTPADNATSAPYVTGWSYNKWVANMQIAPYAERYIVAVEYKTLYENLKKLADKAVAQGQITVSDAYANGQDLKSAKAALNILDATFIKRSNAGERYYSGATFQVGGVQYTATTDGVDNDLVLNTANGMYYIVPVGIYGGLAGLNAVDVTVATADLGIVQFYAVPAQTLTSQALTFYDYTNVTDKVAKRFPAGSTATFDGKNGRITATGLTPVDLSPLQILYAYATYTSKLYQEDVDNALEVATEMQKDFAKAASYYNGQINEGVAYLIQNVRPDLADVKAANIGTCAGFDLDPYDKLKWNLKESKTIAFTSPTINNNMKETDSCVVLHFNTTSCKWESIDAKFVKYNGVLGIEGDFSSCSPVIVVTLKDYVDNGAAAAATATDAKKSPHTGEEF